MYHVSRTTRGLQHCIAIGILGAGCFETKDTLSDKETNGGEGGVKLLLLTLILADLILKGGIYIRLAPRTCIRSTEAHKCT